MVTMLRLEAAGCQFSSGSASRNICLAAEDAEDSEEWDVEMVRLLVPKQPLVVGISRLARNSQPYHPDEFIIIPSASS